MTSNEAKAFINAGNITWETVGDKTDTSPYRDMSEQEYISTPAYIRNMHELINYLKSIKKTEVRHGPR